MDKPLEYADDLDDDEARQALCTSNACADPGCAAIEMTDAGQQIAAGTNCSDGNSPSYKWLELGQEHRLPGVVERDPRAHEQSIDRLVVNKGSHWLKGKAVAGCYRLTIQREESIFV